MNISNLAWPKLQDHLKNFSFVLPAVLIFSIFYIYPFFDIFRLSFHEWNGITPTMKYVELQNFRELMQDTVWWQSMGHAAYITLIALTFQNVFAFALALACDREIRMKRFYRVVFFIPPVLSEVVVGFIWQWILYAGMQDGQHIGLLNYWLTKTGLPHLVHNWLSDPDTALTCIAVVHSWKGFGWDSLCFWPGCRRSTASSMRPRALMGPAPGNFFTNVTVPMMVPVMLVVVILTVLGSMQVFVLVLSMVGQGLGYHTEVPVTRILSAMTGTNRFGYACAMGVNFGVVLIMVSVAFKWLSNRMKQA